MSKWPKDDLAVHRTARQQLADQLFGSNPLWGSMRNRGSQGDPEGGQMGGGGMSAGDVFTYTMASSVASMAWWDPDMMNVVSSATWGFGDLTIQTSEVAAAADESAGWFLSEEPEP